MSPTIAGFHTFYWEYSDTVTTPAQVSHGGYPVWQSAVIAPSLFGMIGAWLDTKWDQAKWIYRLMWKVLTLPNPSKRLVSNVVDLLMPTGERWHPEAGRIQWRTDIEALPPEKRREYEAVLNQVVLALQHPSFEVAHDAVRQTATTLGFNQPQAWVKLSHTLKDHHGWAENTWRHLNACQLIHEGMTAQGSTLTNSQRHLVAQLAYVGFAATQTKYKRA